MIKSYMDQPTTKPANRPRSSLRTHRNALDTACENIERRDQWFKVISMAWCKAAVTPVY